MVVLSQLMREVSEYVATVDDVYGHYLDSTRGFANNVHMLDRTQKEMAIRVPPVNFDLGPFIYGDGALTEASTKLQHRTTQGIFRIRNTRGGHNYVIAAQMLVVLVFEYWESEHRSRIAAALGLKEATDLRVPILGDLRLLRQDIIHHRGIVRPDTERKLQTLSGFATGATIALDFKSVAATVRQVKGAMDQIVVGAGGADPLHREILRFR